MAALPYRFSLGLGLVALLLVMSVHSVGAVSQPSLKMRIVAPECTLDTIDDGSGPVQVITCPPGTEEPGTDTPSNEDESSTSAETSNGIPQVSRRVASSADTFMLLNSLEDFGLSVDLPKNTDVPYQNHDEAPLPAASDKDDGPNLLITTVFSVAAAGSVVLLINIPHLLSGAYTRLFRRFKK